MPRCRGSSTWRRSARGRPCSRCALPRAAATCPAPCPPSPASRPTASTRRAGSASVTLPPTREQQGARIVVLRGERGDGKRYVSQVLLERVGDEVVPHEPGFWLGTRYTALQEGRSWATQSDEPAQRRADQASTLRACTDRAEWLAEVTGT